MVGYRSDMRVVSRECRENNSHPLIGITNPMELLMTFPPYSKMWMLYACLKHCLVQKILETYFKSSGTRLTGFPKCICKVAHPNKSTLQIYVYIGGAFWEDSWTKS